MRTTLITAVLALSAAGVVAGATNPSHVRPLTPTAAALLTDATTRSPIVNGMVEALGLSDVVVYLTDTASGELRLPAHMQFMSFAGGTRYLLVRIDRWSAPPRELIPRLGHELQHALEIALAPEVQDGAGLVRLYRRIGWECGSAFESDGARATEDRVRSELAGFDRTRSRHDIFRGFPQAGYSRWFRSLRQVPLRSDPRYP